MKTKNEKECCMNANDMVVLEQFKAGLEEIQRWAEQIESGMHKLLELRSKEEA